MSRGALWKITWGAAYANTWTAGHFLNNPKAGPQPAEGSDFLVLESGVEDAYVALTDEMLRGEVHHLPYAPAGGVTGWDGAASSGDGEGVRDALTWLRAKNVGRFYPDAAIASYWEFYLKSPMTDDEIEFHASAPWLRRFPLVMKSIDSTALTGY
jgi:hypothetical protein